MAGRVIVKGAFSNVSASARFTAALTASISSSPLADGAGRRYAVADGEILSQPVQGTFDAATKTWTVAVVPVAGVIYRISAPGFMPDCFVESAAYLPMPAGGADVVVDADTLVGQPGGDTLVEYVTLTTVIASIDSKVASAVDDYLTAHPPTGGGGGVTDHGALTGLANDDHPHYLTDVRGDLRYPLLTDDRLTDARPPSGSAGGGLAGTYPNPNVAALRGVTVSATAPTAGQVLTASSGTAAAWTTPAGAVASGGVVHFVWDGTAWTWQGATVTDWPADIPSGVLAIFTGATASTTKPSWAPTGSLMTVTG